MKSFQVHLNMVDEEAIQQAAAIAARPYATYPAARPGWQPQHVLTIGDRHALSRLRAIGLTTRKSLVAKWPEPDLPYPFAFLRGAFDGDGHFGSARSNNGPRLHASLCGSFAFLTAVNGLLAPLGISPKTIHPKDAIHTLRWGHFDSLRLGEAMYADGGAHLARKRAVFTKCGGGSATTPSQAPIVRW